MKNIRAIPKIFLTTALLGLLAAGVQGCFPLMVTGAAVTSLAATDRRTTGTQLEDKTIELKTCKRVGNQFPGSVHVNCNSYNRRILITGEVLSAETKAQIEAIAKGVENVESVINELEIAGPASFTARSNDVLITSKVKASFVDASDLYANAFKVTTERGIVYLQGLVTQREGDRAAEIASRVGGVAKVVKLFEYISEDELKKLSTLSAPSEPAQK
ncbi:MAG: BON domain-containing protein [Burkholderiaceae bacterium]|nr:MAG: BON domain-containing protein [Burkholderiaceae bacterium]